MVTVTEWSLKAQVHLWSLSGHNNIMSYSYYYMPIKIGIIFT